MSYGLVFREPRKGIIYLGRYTAIGLIRVFEPIEDAEDVFSELRVDQFVFTHVIDNGGDNYCICDIYTMTMNAPIMEIIQSDDFIDICMTLFAESLDRMDEDQIFFDEE